MYEDKKIILFDGTSLDGWAKRDGTPADWILEDGIMTVSHGDIVSKVTYGDALLHVEFREPDMPDEKGQGKGNSGVYVHGCYEIQVLDSYGVTKPTDGDCSAIYNMYAPLTNACKHRVSRVVRRDIVDKFLNQHRFAHTSTGEQTGFATFC